jgi:hypothetical protein
MDDDKEKRSDSGLRLYLGLNQIFILALLALAVVIAAWHPTAPRIAGLALLAALTIVYLFVNRASPRVYGFGLLALAGLFVTFGEFALPGWGMEPSEFGVSAVTLGAIALGLISTNKKTGEPNAYLENGVGTLVLLSLLIVTGIVAWRGAPTITHPAGLVFMEALAALADVAGERWKWRLALTSIFPIAVLVAEYAKPEWRHLTFYGLHPGYAFLRSHTHSWMIWPVLFVGLNSLIVSLKKQRGWRASLVRLLGIVIGVWVLLLLVEAILG